MADKRSFTVTWTVELRARDPEEAGLLARNIMINELENRVANGLELRVTPAGGRTVWVDL